MPVNDAHHRRRAINNFPGAFFAHPTQTAINSGPDARARVYTVSCAPSSVLRRRIGIKYRSRRMGTTIL